MPKEERGVVADVEGTEKGTLPHESPRFTIGKYFTLMRLATIDDFG
jgi:hypothetical protein